MENYVVPGLKEAVALAMNDYNWRPVRTLLEVTIPTDSVEYRQLQQIDVNDNIIEEACSSGFTELVSIFLKNGFPANYTVNKSFVERMLHLAASKGFLSLVKLLLNIGADIDCKAHDGKTPLFYAVQGGHLEVVKHLINVGADINMRDEDGEILLEKLLRCNMIAEEILQLLLDSVCEPRKCCACCPALHDNKLNLVRILLEAGAHVNGMNTSIPLHKAVRNGNIPIMELLFEYGADVNITDIYGNTVLHKAVVSKKLESVKFLIEHGSLINSVDNYHETPLSISIEIEQFDIAMLLINSGADLNLPIYNTVLHTAVRFSAPIHVIECLLEHGASVTAVHYRITALQYVISCSNLNNDWKLHLAKLLLIYGSNHYVEDRNGNTLLHWACETGDVGLVEYLIDYGLEVDAKNRQGKKPMDIAHETGHPAIVNIIIEYHCNKYSI